MALAPSLGLVAVRPTATTSGTRFRSSSSSGRQRVVASLLPPERPPGQKKASDRYLGWLESAPKVHDDDAAMMSASRLVVAAAAATLLLSAAVLSDQWTNEVSFVAEAWRSLPSFDFAAVLADVDQRVDELGPAGCLYFSAVYVVAEILALPAVPLTASAGYLFGAVRGTAVVLASATVAAGVSFLIGRFLLRGWVESVAAESPQFRAIDRSVEREGFKIVLLLRLSPIFPFALSNYFYGLTSVDFGSYLLATLIGFAPGTALYVYGGEVASLVQTANADPAQAAAPFPWYVYAGFLAAGIALASKVTDIASSALQEADSSFDGR